MDLPSYERPPVVEVALSIQFAPLQGFSSLHAGLLWNELKDEFPTFEEQPALPPVFEVFGARPAILAPQFELVTSASPNRFWFITKSGSEVIQVQQNRLIYNWRKQAEQDRYPRYETIREHFAHVSSKLLNFFAEKGLGRVQPNQCEVIYINFVTLPDDVDPRGKPQRVLAPWSGTTSDDFLPEMEDVQMQLRYPLKHEGKNVGRLYIQVAPTIRTHDSHPGVQITMTARGRPQEESISSAFAMLDLCRGTIVRGFTSITTPELHKYWGKNNG